MPDCYTVTDMHQVRADAVDITLTRNIHNLNNNLDNNIAQTTPIEAPSHTLRVSMALFTQFRLSRDRVLTAEEYTALTDALALADAKKMAVRMLSNHAMTSAVLYEKLLKKEVSEENANACIQYLEDNRFLDDARYASDLVRRCRARGYGYYKIRDQLYKAKVPRDLWDDAFEKLEEMEDEGEVQESETLIDNLIQKKLKGERPDAAMRKKVTDALVRRGFRYQEIREGLQRYLDDLD